MKSKEKKPYHHGDLKSALITAGIDILEEEGLERLSLRGIAARAGVSHTAPKNHFGSLKALLTAIAAEGWRRHADAMRGSLTQDATPQDRLYAMAEGYVRFAQKNPALYQLMLSPLHCDTEDEDYRRAGSESYQVLSGVAAELVRASDLPEGSNRRIESMLWTIAHGYVSLSQAGLLSTKADHGATLSILDILPDFPGLPE